MKAKETYHEVMEVCIRAVKKDPTLWDLKTVKVGDRTFKEYTLARRILEQKGYTLDYLTESL